MIAAAWILVFPLVLFQQGAALLLEPDCGYITPVAGDAAPIRSPWMALIQGHFFIIEYFLPEHVITTASCIANAKKGFVRLGDINNPDPRMYEEYPVYSGTIHSLYNETTYLNDIILLKLRRKVDYKPHIRPICLLVNANTLVKARFMKTFTATLLGLESSQFRNPETIIMHHIHPSRCKETLRFPLENSQICAETQSAASCVEKGSPLGKYLQVNGTRRYSLFGIQSYDNSEACVYTNIIGYIEWIVEHILGVNMFTIN